MPCWYVSQGRHTSKTNREQIKFIGMNLTFETYITRRKTIEHYLLVQWTWSPSLQLPMVIYFLPDPSCLYIRQVDQPKTHFASAAIASRSEHTTTFIGRFSTDRWIVSHSVAWVASENGMCLMANRQRDIFHNFESDEVSSNVHRLKFNKNLEYIRSFFIVEIQNQIRKILSC